MIAISTIHMILQHKQKYSPIGQTDEGSTNDPIGTRIAGIVKKQFGELAGTILPKVNALMSEFDGTIAAANVGASVMTSQFETLSGTITETIKQITFLEQREASLTSTFKTGTDVLAKRTRAFTVLQQSIGATNNQMAQYRALLEAPSDGLTGQLFAKVAEAAENALAAAKQGAKQKEAAIISADQKAYINAQLEAYHYLSRNTNLTAEQQSSFNLYAAGTNKTLAEQILATREITKGVASAINPATAFSVISAEIAGMASDMRQQYSKIPGNLEVAILKSKQLGVSMEQLNKTGRGLLNIEESVGNEISYQLLSGKKLLDNRGNSITQQYREATLMGNARKQAQLLQQVYLTQNDILENGNVYQKDALATTLYMSTQELMNMYEKQKLQDKINEKLGVSADEYANILDNEELEKQYNIKVQDLAGKDDEVAKTLQTINKLEASQKSPATLWYEKALSVWDTGLNVKITNEKLATARESGNTYGNRMMELSKVINESALQTQLGNLQLKSHVGNTIVNTINKISSGLPILGTAVQTMSGIITKFNTEFVYGAPMEGSNKETTAGVSKTNDAIIGINDGIIQFNDKDKLTVVASPFGTMNEKVANKIANPSSGNSGVDTNAIVAAISQAFSKISISVAVDPMAIDKEIKFRQGSLNA